VSSHSCILECLRKCQKLSIIIEWHKVTTSCEVKCWLSHCISHQYIRDHFCQEIHVSQLMISDFCENCSIGSLNYSRLYTHLIISIFQMLQGQSVIQHADQTCSICLCYFRQS